MEVLRRLAGGEPELQTVNASGVVERHAKVDAGRAALYLVEILETHVDEEALGENGKPLAGALDPLIFTPDGHYYGLGQHLGEAWSIGKALE